MDAEQLIQLGFVRRAHGIRGEIRIAVEPRYAEMVEALATLYVDRETGGAKGDSIEWARPHQGEYLVKLESVGDRTLAESLAGREVFADRADLEAAGWDGLPPEAIAGFEVVDEEGVAIGVLHRVDTYPGSDMFIIRTGEGREVLVPAVPEIVVEIDQAAERIILRPPKGLLDIENG